MAQATKASNETVNDVSLVDLDGGFFKNERITGDLAALNDFRLFVEFDLGLVKVDFSLKSRIEPHFEVDFRRGDELTELSKTSRNCSLISAFFISMPFVHF